MLSKSSSENWRELETNARRPSKIGVNSNSIKRIQNIRDGNKVMEMEDALSGTIREDDVFVSDAGSQGSNVRPCAYDSNTTTELQETRGR